MAEVDMDTGAVTYKPTFEWEPGVHPAADLFPMLDPEAFTKLVGDIDRNGQRDPIWLDTDGRLIDGRNRLAACQRLGVEPITRTYSGDAVTDLVISLNVHRRHLTASQLACVAVDALPLFEEEARARQVEAGKRYGEGHPQEVLPHGSEPLKPTGHARSVDVAADALGIGATTVSRAKRVKAADPETFEKVKAGEKSVREAEREVIEVETRFKTKSTKNLAMPQPSKMGGNRRKHLAQLDALLTALDGATQTFTGVTELDASVTKEEAARVLGDLQSQISSLNKIKQLIKERTT